MKQILAALKTGSKNIHITGLRGAAAALAGVAVATATNKALLCITPSEHQAELLEQDLSLFSDRQILLYPGYDIPPYTPLSPDPSTLAARLATLYHILTADRPYIVVTSAEALLRRVIPKNKLSGLAELVISGEETDQHELAQRLAVAGYEPVSLVQTVGDFTIRGGIVDIFPPGLSNPLRLDFFGDTVESIRTFDPISQRSIATLAEAVLLPASNILFPAPHSDESKELRQRFEQAAASLDWPVTELNRILEHCDNRSRFPGIEFFLPLFYGKTACLLDYLAEDSLVLLQDLPEIHSSIDLVWARIKANYEEARKNTAPALAPASIFLDDQELEQRLGRFTCLRLHDFVPEDKDKSAATLQIWAGNHKLLKQQLDLERKKEGLLVPLYRQISEWLKRREPVLMACRSQRHANHLAELFSQANIDATIRSAPITTADLSPPDDLREIILFDQPLSEGFDLADLPDANPVHLLSESELFGERRLGKRQRKTHRREPATTDPLRFEELRPGDMVVHSDHGLGIYEGLIHLDLHNIANDFMQINYQNNDKLYVPVDRINCVDKYRGISDRKPKIDKLGGKSWPAIKKKVSEAVWKVAQDLLQLYARRELQEGHAFSPTGELFFELEESFPFDETAGQKKAINEVLADLSAPRPMDRLICGDVGYGKTEVAVRAAFKAVEDGYQVTVLVPTTVLAEQHAATFRERFAGLPVRLASLNRFRSPKEQKEIIRDLANGKIDIVIGTHRLLSKDVAIKKLGLLIVDEEHRFGVSHKEKIKRLRTKVDILTLTATPIPRTLQLSLLGIRDLSVINTPPEHRRTIKTFVARYDDLVIKEAIGRELQRGGQVFLVHNRVQSIHEMARKVQKLLPAARVAVAHGQMTPRNLEEIMVRFVKRELDVLVCTTIIESGLDIPNANTIIINRADRLGLAEIYQLRGRVGRSKEQSYAYLLVPSLDSLSRDAKNRLRALMDYNELGGGFKLAMSDLQIRGGGNILGVSQSGNIAAVGYDLYLDLLQKTIEDLKHKSDDNGATAGPEPEINLRVSAYLPETYIADTDQRYVAYRRIGAITTYGELQDMANELKDRYGAIPQETENLLDIMHLKTNLRALGINKLEQGKEALIFSFNEQTPVEPQKILTLMENSANRIRFTPDARLVVSVDSGLLQKSTTVISMAADILQALRPEGMDLQ